jgi:hypothetical protein
MRRGSGRVATDLMDNINLSSPWDTAPI